jgi:hypothetical protein
MAFLQISLIVFLIVSFSNQIEIAAASDGLKSFISFVIGIMLETSEFLYIWLLPLKIAKDITGKKLRSFSSHGIDPSTHSFVGTVVGALVGTTYVLDTVLFSNLNFLFRSIAMTDDFSPALICVVICAILAVSLGALYKEILREWRKIPCVKRRFPVSARSYTVSREEAGMYTPGQNQ